MALNTDSSYFNKSKLWPIWLNLFILDKQAVLVKLCIKLELETVLTDDTSLTVGGHIFN